jgi:hypothetical protein
MKILAKHYVDITGNLRTTICDEEVDLLGEELPTNITVFMSGATCLACIDRIQQKLASIDQASAYAERPFSSASRISSLDMPARLAHATP